REEGLGSQAGLVTGHNVHQAQGFPHIRHTVAGSQDGLIFPEIRYRPAQTRHRPKIVPIVSVKIRVGIWGTPADELYLRKVALECSGPVHIGPGSAGYAEETG